MTFGELPIGARFATESSPGCAKIKTGFGRWKWADHVGFLPVANRYGPDRAVIQIRPTTEERPMEQEIGHIRNWADGYRHAADNRHYHLDPITARETAKRFDQAADRIAELEEEVERLRGDLAHANDKAQALLAEAQVLRLENQRLRDQKIDLHSALVDIVRVIDHYGGLAEIDGDLVEKARAAIAKS